MKGLCSYFYSAAGIIKRIFIFSMCVFLFFTADYAFAGTEEPFTLENINAWDTERNYKIANNGKFDDILRMWPVTAGQPLLLTERKADFQYLYHIAELQSSPEYINPYVVDPLLEIVDKDIALIRTWPINARESTSLLLFGIGLLSFARWSKKKNQQENSVYNHVVKTVSLLWVRLSCSFFRGKKLRTDVSKNPGA